MKTVNLILMSGSENWTIRKRNRIDESSTGTIVDTSRRDLSCKAVVRKQMGESMVQDIWTCRFQWRNLL
jgi:hypothetical protein